MHEWGGGEGGGVQEGLGLPQDCKNAGEQKFSTQARVRNLSQSMGARNRVGLGLSYVRARYDYEASDLGSWNWFLAPKRDLSFERRIRLMYV